MFVRLEAPVDFWHNKSHWFKLATPVDVSGDDDAVMWVSCTLVGSGLANSH